MLALLLMAAAPCVLHDKQGKPVADPCGPGTPVIYQIPAAFAERAKDEAALTQAINQHLAETQAGMLNVDTLRKLNRLLVKVQKDLQNEYVRSK